MKYRYLVFDVYDVDIGSELTKDELIGKANTKQEIKNIWNTQDDETDGECYIIIYDRATKNFVEYKDIRA